MSHQQNLKAGILAALSAALFLALMNMSSKLLSDQIHPITVAFWRNILSLVLLTAFLFVTKKVELIKTQRLKGHILRSVIGTCGFVFSIFAFQLLPLTEATAILFTSPLFVVFLSYPLLKERVGPYRSIATLIGFSGVILIIGFDVAAINQTGVMFALALAVCNAFVLICLRWLGDTEHALTTTFYFMLIGTLMTGAYLPFADKILPDPSLYWAVAFIGIIGLLSLIFKTEAYRHAPANVIAPLSYTMLIWVALLDFAIWQIVSPIHVWAGAAIIIGSNLFILYRENKRKIKRVQTHDQT